MARRRRHYRRNPISPDTQKLLLLGVGGAVIAGIAYAIYRANQPAVAPVASGVLPAPPAFPPASAQTTVVTPPGASNVLTPTGSSTIPLQAQNAPVITTPASPGIPAQVTGGNEIGWNLGY
jgi:hypothetical protein